MWAFIPAPPSAAIMNRIEELTHLSPRIWVTSGGWHLLVAMLLLLVIPAQTFFSRTNQNHSQEIPRAGPSPAPQGAQETAHLERLLSPAQMEKMAEQIHREQSDSARERVGKILEKEKELDRLAKQSISEFQDSAKKAAASLNPSLKDLHKSILATQQSSLAAQNELKKTLEGLDSKTATNSPPSDKLNNLQQLQAKEDSLRSLETTLQSQQASANDLLGEAAMNFPDVAKAQEKAAEAQSTAAGSVEKQDRLLSQLKNLLEQSATSTQSALKAQEHIEREQTRTSAQQSSLPSDQAKLDQARQDLQALKQAHAPKVQLTEETKLVQQNSKQVAADQKLANSQEKAIERLKKSNETLIQKAQQASHAADQTKGQLAQAIQETINAQTLAIQHESVLLNQMDTYSAQNESSSPTLSKEALRPLDQAEPATNSLEKNDLAQLYQMALQAEGRLNEKFRLVRAAQLATIQHLPLDKALGAVRPVLPERKPIDSTLLSPQGSHNKFSAFKEQVIQAKEQIESIASTAENLLAATSNKENSGTPSFHLQGENSAEQYKESVARATADDIKVGKDLTAVMTQQANQSASSSPPGATQGHGGGAQSVGGAVSKENEAAKATLQGPPQGLVPEYGRLDNQLPSLDPKRIDALPTRKITTASGPNHKEWLYVDTWYIIGPFPDEERRNLYTKFPPESVIDLDAIYVGKNNKPMGWKLFQWSSPMLKMPNDLQETPAVYYAYTELSFEHPIDLWIATGSDDRGTMWLNGFMVWNSNDHLKRWQPNEGYRKVHFQEGRNRILYRLENGLSDAVFSLMIHIAP